MKKFLVLVLAFLLIFSVSAFAGEADPADPQAGQQAQTTAQAEAPAAQAFTRSLDVYGVWTWRYEQFSLAIPDSEMHTVDQSIRNMVEANFTYKVAEDLQIKFSLAWGAYYGSGRANGFYSSFQGTYRDYLAANLGTSEWLLGSTTANLTTGAVSTGGVSINGTTLDPGKLIVKQVYAVWKPSFGGQFQIGRQDTTWGYKSITFGSVAGADRFAYVGDFKAFGYRMLPILVYELRKDQSTATGDEQNLVLLAAIMLKPGSLLEQIWINVGYYFGGPRVQTAGVSAVTGSTGTSVTPAIYDPAGLGRTFQTKWQLFVYDVTLKLRMGNMLELNFEVTGTLGSSGRFINTAATGDDQFTAKKWNTLTLFLNAIVNLGMIELKADFLFVSRPAITVNEATGKVTADGAADGWFARAADYNPGGRIMMIKYFTFIPGATEGLFSAALTGSFKLMGGKLVPWLKVATAFSLSDYWFVSAAVGYQKTYLGQEKKKWQGLEIDLGVRIQLADGFTMSLEFDYWMAGDGAKKTPVLGASMVDNALGVSIGFDLKF